MVVGEKVPGFRFKVSGWVPVSIRNNGLQVFDIVMIFARAGAPTYSETFLYSNVPRVA